MKLKPLLSLLITILTSLILAPAPARADAVADWNLIAIQRIGAANPAHPPPLVFIDMAIVQAAVYDPFKPSKGSTNRITWKSRVRLVRHRPRPRRPHTMCS